MTAEDRAVLRLPFALPWLRRMRFPHKIGILDRLYGRSLASKGVQRVRTHAGPVWTLNLKSASHRRMVYDEYLGLGVAAWCRQWLGGGVG